MLADDIRNFAFEKYIEPTRQKKMRKVTIRSGEVHDEMKLHGRMPAVCGAIGTRKFEELYNVRLTNRKDPTQGSNIYFTFELS